MRPILIAVMLAVGLLAAPVALAAAHDARGDDASDASTSHGKPAKAENATHEGKWAELLAKMKDVRQGCRAEKADHANMTGAENRSWARCIRDGYRGLFESFHLGRHGAKSS